MSWSSIQNFCSCAYIIPGKEFIIKEDNEITFNYVLNCTRRGHVKVFRFYIVLRLAKGSHDEARHIRLKNNNMMRMMR